MVVCWQAHFVYTLYTSNMKGNTMTTDNNANVNSEPDEPDNIVECSSCNCEIDTDNDVHHHGYLHTGRYRSRESLSDAGEYYCDGCFFFCDDCEEPTHIEQSMTIDGGWSYRNVCPSCYDNYASCANCGSTYHSDEMHFDEHPDWDDEWLCNHCFDQAEYESMNSSHLIRPWSYKPRYKRFWFVPNDGERVTTSDSLHFAGVSSIVNISSCYNDSEDESIELHKDELFLGLEIENNRTKRVSLHEPAKYLLGSVFTDGTDAENYMYLKEDGSISGFEIVTHPATLEAHKVLLPREALPQLQRRYGLTGWSVINGQEAGIHVHLSKTAFTHSHLHKFQMFQYRNQEWLKLFAGRDSQQFASFDRQQAYQHGYPKYKMSDFSKGDYDNGDLRRYHALNFVPSETLELRYFRSTLKAETILAILELIHGMYRYTNSHDSKFFRANQFSWNMFREWIVEQQEYEFVVPTMDRRKV